MFTPRYVKHSKLLLRHARKYLRYKDDLLSTATREELRAGVAALDQALRKRKRDRDDSMWFGAKSMYDRAGFVEVARRKPARPVVRKALRPRRA